MVNILELPPSMRKFSLFQYRGDCSIIKIISFRILSDAIQRIDFVGIIRVLSY